MEKTASVLSDAAFLIYYRIVLCYCRNQLFSSSISSIYSLVLLRRGTLCCPPNFPFVPASHGIGLCGQQSPPEVAGQCFLSFCFIIGIHFFQCIIQYFGKILYTVRCLYKLDQPLVTAFSIGIHKYRSSRIIGNQCSGSLASPCQTFSALSTINSSPKALMKCLVRPVMTNLYGSFA